MQHVRIGDDRLQAAVPRVHSQPAAASDAWARTDGSARQTWVSNTARSVCVVALQVARSTIHPNPGLHSCQHTTPTPRLAATLPPVQLRSTAACSWCRQLCCGQEAGLLPTSTKLHRSRARNRITNSNTGRLQHRLHRQPTLPALMQHPACLLGCCLAVWALL